MADNITKLQSYDLNGVKESFANWISNISPTDTPFVSMTGKESIQNKYFQWQHDTLGKVNTNNAVAEGSDAGNASQNNTSIEKNVTQILRKVVSVSDTADSLSSYGRGSELAYQMEKAGAEIKRDLEWAFLNQGKAVDLSAPGVAIGQPDNSSPAVNNTGTRKTAGFAGLVSTTAADTVDGSTATVVATSATKDVFTETELFDLTAALYEVGAQPNIVMFHPKHAKTFSALMESTAAPATRIRMFDGAEDSKINTYVSTVIDPLGQEFKLIPNRFMDPAAIYIFNPADWTQMVLRAPQRTKLAKTGSSEKWMIEMEVGLRHRNPHASGILNIKKV